MRYRDIQWRIQEFQNLLGKEGGGGRSKRSGIVLNLHYDFCIQIR